MSTIVTLQPHQQRVVKERDELQTLAQALSTFINDNPLFQSADEAEKARLIKQNQLQFELINVLNERVAYFSYAPHVAPI